MHASAHLKASATAQAFAGVQALVGALALGALTLGACSRPAPFNASGAAASSNDDSGYRVPPELRGGVRTADGAVSLNGQAWPSSKVRMVSAAGVRIETMSDGSGVWTAMLGPVSEPTLFRLAEENGAGQRVEAEGLVAVLPGAPVVALLRAGYGAEVKDASPGLSGKDSLKILAVDYDSGGGVVVSGRAPPGAAVRVMVDGQAAIPGQAGADGRFSLTLPKSLAPGTHQLQVTSGQATVGAEVPVGPPAPPKDAPYQIQAEPFGWRIDWVTAGGGPQTTLLLGG